MLRRARWAFIALSTLAVVAVLSLVIASQGSMSSSQAAANATPPPPGPTDAEVEERALAETLSLRGVITAPTAVVVPAPQPDTEGGRAVVTGLPAAAGSLLTAPAVVAEVAGRPIIALQSAATFYRDLTFGDEGRDVATLQSALHVAETGRFDGPTQNSLSRLYEDLGYSAPENDSSEDEAEGDPLQTLQDAVEDARLNGDAAVAAAELGLREAQAATAQGSVDTSPVDRARQELERSRSTRDRDVSRAERDLATERTRVQRQALVEGTRFDSDEVVGVPFASTTVIGVRAQVGAVVEPGTEVATLGDPTLRAVTHVSLAEAQMLVPDMSVDITASSLSAGLSGRVLSVAGEPSTVDAETADTSAVVGSAPSQDRPYRVEVELAQQPPSTSVGSGVLLTVTVQGTNTAVIAVPVVALQRIDGRDVVVTLPDRRRWEVEPGFTAEGWVQLRSGAPPVGSHVETR